MPAGSDRLLCMGELNLRCILLRVIINDSINTTRDCNCAMRQNAENSGVLPQIRPAGAATGGAVGFHNGS